MNKTSNSHGGTGHRGTKARSEHHTPPVPHEEHGQAILHRVEARKKDLEATLARAPNDPVREPSHAASVEAAISALDGLLSGDLTNINPATAAELNQWLESSKHLCEVPPKAHRSAKH